MRHQKSNVRRFGRATAHRKAMMRNLVTSLVKEERIVTTLEKAKELRKVADRMITLGKTGTLHARRNAHKMIFERDAVTKVFEELAPRFKTREGGYTRIHRLGNRQGDNAMQAIIEYVDNNVLAAKKEKIEAKAKAAEERSKTKED